MPANYFLGVMFLGTLNWVITVFFRRHTVIGSNNIIGHHAVVGVKCQDLKYKEGAECFLDIGDNNEIREYCSIHRSSKADDRTVCNMALLHMLEPFFWSTYIGIISNTFLQVIGHNNLIMGSCHIAHDCKIASNNILANNTLLAGHVIVECRILCTLPVLLLSISIATLAHFVSLAAALWSLKMFQSL